VSGPGAQGEACTISVAPRWRLLLDRANEGRRCGATCKRTGLIPDALMNDRFLKRESMRSAQRPSPPGPVSSQGVWYKLPRASDAEWALPNAWRPQHGVQEFRRHRTVHVGPDEARWTKRGGTSTGSPARSGARRCRGTV